MAQGCILHIDDDENERFLLEHCADTADLRAPVVSLPSGQDAIEYLKGINGYSDRNRFPLPCLILLDLKMPGLDGFDVIRWIREQPELQTLPVIMLSSSNFPGDIEKGMKLGLNAFVSKPSNLDNFVELMKSIDAFWLHYHEFDPTSDCNVSGRFPWKHTLAPA